MNRVEKPLGGEPIQEKQNHQQIFGPDCSSRSLRAEADPDPWSTESPGLNFPISDPIAQGCNFGLE